MAYAPTGAKGETTHSWGLRCSGLFLYAELQMIEIGLFKD